MPVDELVLHDIDPERRTVVGEMAARMLERQGFSGSLTVTDDLDAAVSGASFVLLQLRVGGQAARLRDETVPLACGCIGQETTGAGGFAKAMRTVPVVLEIAERVRALAAPDAWIVDFTNPVGIVTRALLDAGHRAIGLCNVAITVQREIARLVDIEPERVLVDHVGLNHLTWVRRVLVDGQDRLPDLLDEHGDALAAHAGLPLRLLEELGAIPSSYLRYFYAHDAVLAEQQDGVPRAAAVAEIETRLLDIYRDAEVAEKPVAPRAAGRRVLQRGRDGADRVALGGHRRRAGRRRPKRRSRRRAAARRRRRASRPHRARRRRAAAAGAARARAARARAARRGLRAAHREAAVTRDPVTARKALLTHPLIGQDDVSGTLLESLLAEEPVSSAGAGR